MNDRIIAFIESLGISTAEFERNCGLSNGAVAKMGDGTRRSTIDKISNVYSNLNKAWLLTGEGPMLKGGGATATDTEAIYQTASSATLVPLVPLRGQAGTLVGFSEDGIRESECEMVISPVDDAAFAIAIYGDSMIPEYPSGSRVFVTKIDPTSYIQWGDVFLLDTTNGIILKEVQPSSKDDHLTCHSLNPSGRYKDFDVPMKDIRGMYRVVACVIPK